MMQFMINACNIYSNDDAGTFGAVFIFTGLIGAGVAGSCLYVIHGHVFYSILLWAIFFVHVPSTIFKNISR